LDYESNGFKDLSHLYWNEEHQRWEAKQSIPKELEEPMKKFGCKTLDELEAILKKEEEE
jgi:hypothetical protein